MSCLICASTGFFLDSKTNKSSSEATTCALMMFCGKFVVRPYPFSLPSPSGSFPNPLFASLLFPNDSEGG